MPERLGYVVDDVERLVIDHDYRPLGDIDDDVLLLEWDIAVSKEDLVQFAATARRWWRESVIVAPYRIYYEHMLSEPVWAHRSWDGEPKGMANPVGAVPVGTGQPTCNLFGLGMVYLPAKLVRAFIDAKWSNKFGDVEFSMWHYLHVTQDVPICWDVHPVHLNYRTPQVH